MNVFIFGIGGTGARVLRSLSYCLAANMGHFKPGTNFVPMIIDHDKTNGDKTIAIEALEQYKRIHRLGYNGVNLPENARNFFLPDVKYLSEITLGDPNGLPPVDDSFEFEFGISNRNGQGSFADYIDAGALNGNLKITSELLSALYNDGPQYVTANGKQEENPIAELNLNLGKGFRGNPNIGTVVFDDIRNTTAYQRFEKVFNPNSDCVIVIGSIFGGTGSSGVPKLIEAIRANQTPGWSTAKVGCIMVMPYFKVDTPKDKGVTPAIHDNIFKSKQKAALSFYKDCQIGNQTMNKAFSSIYYVAEEDSLQTGNQYSEGDESQKNGANIVELLSAMGIVDFVSKVETGSALNNFNEYGLKADCTENEKLQIGNFIESEQSGALRDLTALAMAMKHFKDYLKPGKIKSGTSYYGTNGLNIPDKINSGIYPEIANFDAKFEDWLKQLSSAKHAFDPYDFTKATDLTTLVKGFSANAGGLFNHEGVSYKDFDSIASTSWTKNKNQGNQEQAFLQVIYDAGVQEAVYATKKPNVKH